MKRMILSLMLVVSVVNVFAMTKSRARQEAWFLTDKMAYELLLTEGQIEDVYEINYDYFRSLSSYNHVYTFEANRRMDYLAYVLTPWQWRKFQTILDFVNPVKVVNRAWHFVIYSRYDRGFHYYNKPYAYTHYKGLNMNNLSYYKNRQKMHVENVNKKANIRPQVNGLHNNKNNSNKNNYNKNQVNKNQANKNQNNMHQNNKPNGSQQNVHQSNRVNNTRTTGRTTNTGSRSNNKRNN
ncbi:MAG: hypothetical protein MJZ83_06210 [Bacteroidaceae bacterium]|nr:hypothetical protein [Bacteroidaceae bacterium]